MSGVYTQHEADGKYAIEKGLVWLCGQPGEPLTVKNWLSRGGSAGRCLSGDSYLRFTVRFQCSRIGVAPGCGITRSRLGRRMRSTWKRGIAACVPKRHRVPGQSVDQAVTGSHNRTCQTAGTGRRAADPGPGACRPYKTVLKNWAHSRPQPRSMPPSRLAVIARKTASSSSKSRSSAWQKRVYVARPVRRLRTQAVVIRSRQ